MNIDSPLRRKPGLRLVVWLGAICALLGFAAGRSPQEEVVLVGPMAKEKILEALPEWARLAKAYEPNIRAVEAIHYFSKPAKILVFFASWKPDAQTTASAFLRTLELADNAGIAVEWIGVSKDLKDPAEALRAEGVDKIPTFIIRVDGVEKGRIIEAPQYTLEEDLASILLELPVSPSADDYDMEFFRTTPHSHLPINCSPCHKSARSRLGKNAGR